MSESCELTIVMPCLNEAETLAVCIDKARGFLARAGVSGEVIVADNGSTDGSQAIAREHGARVVDIPTRGYGSALRGGIAAAHGRFVIMATATTATISAASTRSSRSCARATTSCSATASPAASRAAPCRRCTAISAIRCSRCWGASSTRARAKISIAACAASAATR
jgi:hypothetical protein